MNEREFPPDLIRRMIAALENAEVAMLEIDATRYSGTDPVFVKEIAEVRLVLKETRG